MSLNVLSGDNNNYNSGLQLGQNYSLGIGSNLKGLLDYGIDLGYDFSGNFDNDLRSSLSGPFLKFGVTVNLGR